LTALPLPLPPGAAAAAEPLDDAVAVPLALNTPWGRLAFLTPSPCSAHRTT
jgi:hypothetical protein